MTFNSDLQGCPIIDDSNADELVRETDELQYGRGHIARDYDAEPFGSVEYATPFPFDIIPRSEWADRIEERERLGLRNIDLNVPIKNQQQTNYCWIFAPAHTIEIWRARQGNRYVSLSPASAGAKIKNFRNVGGWGTEGLKFIAQNGLVPSELWPDTAIDRRYDTPQNNRHREHFRCTEWTELQPRNIEQLVTMLLLGFPVATGHNWWRHEVTAMDPVLYDNGQLGILIDNSWGTDWKQNGRAVLSESKATPDDAIAPRSVTASEWNLMA